MVKCKKKKVKGKREQAKGKREKVKKTIKWYKIL